MAPKDKEQNQRLLGAGELPPRQVVFIVITAAHWFFASSISTGPATLPFTII